MDLGLHGRKVIINGGARGLGLAALRQFVAEGCDVAFFGRDAGKVEAARQALASGAGKVIGEVFDMSADHQAYRDWLSSSGQVASSQPRSIRGSPMVASPQSTIAASSGRSNWNITLAK